MLSSRARKAVASQNSKSRASKVATELLIPRNSRFTFVSRKEIVNSTDIRILAGTINARKLKRIIKIELVLKKRNWFKKILMNIYK